MYEHHFGFRLRPFSLLPDPRFLLLTRQHEMAMTMLEYSLRGDSLIAVLTGEVGCGKTTLVRHLMGSLHGDVTVGLISNTHRGSGRLMRWVATAFALEPVHGDVAALFREFVAFIDAERAHGRRVVLIVDEAQNLGAARLEELRVLSNINADTRVDLQLLLVGQPELRVLLRRPKLHQLAQRIGLDFHLGALGRDECRDYVRHRLQVAGGPDDLFSAGALDVAQLHSGGVPRLLNQLCDTALVYAFAEQMPGVDTGLMEQVVQDRVVNGLFPGMKPLQPVAGRGAI